MARPLRIEFAGAFYHVTSRGNERKPVFRSKGDRERFLSYLDSAYQRYGATIHVFCLMDNHYHLLLETPRGNLSQILHHINGAYTTYINMKRKRSGHLFQGRYRAILVEKDAYCQELSRYIHLNPVRAGVVGKASEYPWSSYRYYVGKENEPKWLNTELVLGYFEGSEWRKRGRYREFVEGAESTGMKSPLEEVVASTFLGSEDFITRVKEEFLGIMKVDMRNVPAVRKIYRGPTLKEIEEAVGQEIKADDSLYRKFCVFLSHQYSGLSLEEIGAYFGMKGSAVSQASRRFKAGIGEEGETEKTLCGILKKLHSVES